MRWREFHDAVATVASSLRTMGLQRGDRVGILAPSSAAWDIAQLGAMAAGGVVVGLDVNDTGARLAAIATQCELAALVAQDESLLARFASPLRERMRITITLEPAQSAGILSIADVATGATWSEADWDRSRPDDDALIVFTSGTTGAPKGIAYTHRQVCGAVAAILQAFPDIEPGSRLVCWLPLSNLFQRMINLCAVGRGAQTYYVGDPRTIMEHVAGISPHLFIGVPRFFEKLNAALETAIDAKPGWQKALVRWAIAAGDRRSRSRRSRERLGAGDAIRAELAERLVLRRLRRIMGTNLRFLISGSAPMPLWLLERFHALGLPVLEAYGLSESVVPVAANRPDRFRLGTVGQPLATSEVRIAADGELQLRGPGVFRGYLGSAPPGNEADADGYLATGDYAAIDAEGFITLLGRKSDLFKTSTGRRIAAAEIEGLLRRIPYVEHAVVFGAGRPFPIAVLAVATEALRARIGGRAPEAHPEVAAAAVRADIAAAVAALAGYQRPGGALLTTKPFSIEGGEITPNLKVRRAAVEAASAADIDALYAAIAGRQGAPLTLPRDGGILLIDA